jgi:Ca-activated chloride channel family protein
LSGFVSLVRMAPLMIPTLSEYRTVSTPIKVPLLTLCLGLATGMPALGSDSPAPAEMQNAILVLDASGSMWGQIQGKTKIEIARSAVGDMLQRWPSSNPLGLIAYGHNRKGDCTDIQTLLPVAPLDRSVFQSTVNALNPKGMTPLSAAVIAASEVLKSSEQKATVILVSDGEETCKLDPCQVGRELEAKGVDFTAHVIGFDVPDPAHQAQLRCLAQHTGGQYFNARDAAELSAALGALVSVSTEPALPPATATLSAPAQAPAVSTVTVKFTGPADAGDYIAVVREAAGSVREYHYAWVKPDLGEVQLQTPADAGDYEIRYLSPKRNPSALARQNIRISEVQASIEAPDQVPAGSLVQVVARGPVDPSHWVGFAPKGSPIGSYLAYGRPNAAAEPLALRAPAEPGEYELRYVLNSAERVLFSRAITVTAAEASITAPSTAQAGSVLPIKARGPADPVHWIGFAPKGSPVGSYLDYQRPTGTESELNLNVPAEPGEYEIRYVLNESERIAASASVTVTEATASIDAPATVSVGQSVQLRVSGPVNPGHWVGFAPAGSDPGSYLDYARLEAPQADLQLTAPEQPGNYELRFMLYDSRVLISRPIQVVP